jgi:RimJ/RimL family protein N-acetyltransferase
MKHILANQDEMVARWVASRMPIFEFGSSPYTALGLMTQAGIIAGVVYQNYTKIDIQMHVASIADKRWLNRHFLGECFRYPFEQLGCKRVTALIPAKNETAEAFDKRLGFSYEGRIRQILPDGDDLLLYGMLREECRFLKVGLNHGRKQHSTRDGWRHEAPPVLPPGRNA